MRFATAETPKLSVEKALEKLRGADAPKSRNTRRTEPFKGEVFLV
ncbi:hypothetical protein ACVWXO_003432 [Bradyrhizobium sp. LM2.7]